MKRYQPKPTQWGVWWQWLLATVVAFWLSLFWVEIGEKTDLGVFEGVIGGVIIGILQSLVYKQHLSQAWLWILVNLISWGLLAGSHLGLIGWFAPSTLILKTRFFYGAIFGMIGGFWLGGWQSLVLRQPFSLAWQWIAIAALSWSLGLAFGWTVGGILRNMTHLFISEVIGLSFTWLIVGISTGFAWMKLLSSVK